jgi:hypothetical protein
MAEIERCPFCGGKPEFASTDERARLRCIDCGTEGGLFFFSQEECESGIGDATEARAIAAWNRRSTPAEGAQSQDAKDARRYRWLREFNPTFVAVEMLGASLIGINSKSDGQAAMDSAIDAAIERSDKGSDAGRKE